MRSIALRRLQVLGIACALLGGCDKGARQPAPPPPPPPHQPARTAVADSELRVMLAEVAAARACDLMRGNFRPLRGIDAPDTVTGLLWIRACQVTQHGNKLTFHLSGDGWQWAAAEIKKAGAKFSLHSYVHFSAATTINGALDISYHPTNHVVSLWYTPSETPQVSFEPTGGIDVHKAGAWSSVVGALATVFSRSPKQQATGQARQQGTGELQKQFDLGLSVTIDLCSGVVRFGLGLPGNGKMQPPDVGETRSVPVELQRGALMFFGPYPGRRGFTVPGEAVGGSVHAELVCQADAALLAAAYAEGKPLPKVAALAARDITGKGTLRLGRETCPVVLVVRPVGSSSAPVSFRWKRPAWQAALGPLVSCDKPAPPPAH